MDNLIADITAKMIEYSKGNLHDIEHFLKVFAYAKIIGQKELSDKNTQFILETAAIIHDIACPLCREKYGKAEGNLQEFEGGPLAKEFLWSFPLSEEAVERIVWLVTHHHTYAKIESLDHQILLEADFLVNASECNYSNSQIISAKNNFFRTQTGIMLLDTIYSAQERKI